jgi:uncharacterized protein
LQGIFYKVSAIFKQITVVLLVVFAGFASADIVEHLYDAKLLVADQSQGARKRAAGEGLEQVFVRVSGRRQVTGHPQIAAAIANPEPFLTQYNYLRQTTPEGAVEIFLNLRFSSRQVNAALQSAGMPVWSENRPPVLVWLLADNATGRHFVSSGSEVYSSLLEEAQRRGLALQFPLFDLVDAGNLSQDQLWQLSINDVKRASERYNSPYILMGRASELSTGQWLASWVLIDGDATLRLDTQGNRASEMLSSAVDLVADNQAQRYAVLQQNGIASDSLIQVGGVKSFQDYAQLISYLEGLTVIKHANAVWMKGEQLVLELTLNDDMAKVKRFLSLDGRLQERSATSTFASDGSGMTVQSYYQWTPRNDY